MKLKYMIYMSTALLTTGCNDAFLERAPQSLNDQTFWSTANDLKTYANGFYGLIPAGVSNLDDTNSDTQVPNSINTFLWGQYTVPTEGGAWSQSNWSTIRNLNYFMTHYQNAQGTEAEINTYVGEIRFFRALLYFDKIKTLGDVPWLDKDLNVDSEELYGPKTARNEVAKKIIEDLDFAIRWLPEAGSEEANRLNKDIARHVKARICLHEGTYYKYHTELKYTSEADGLLQQAVEASNALIISGKYEIYNTGHPESDYHNLFTMDDKSNLKEAILYIDYIEDKRMHNMSHGTLEANAGFSKDFVDCILYDDGLPKGVTTQPTTDNTIAEEMAGRDPRFSQLIKNDAYLTDEEKEKANYDDNYVDKFHLTGYHTIKGYIPDLPSGYYVEFTDGIAYRYAETLLINAEAKAELKTLTQDDLDNTINELRDRAGMPHLKIEVGFTDPNWPDYGYTLSPILQEIRRERRVELAGEGFRFDDLRRWKAGHLLDNVMTYVGKKLSNGKYAIVYPNYTNDDLSYQEGKSRKWDDKMYLYPIATGELQRNPQLLPQNPGW
ncbi:RagB/SusD family nutrient uptake outer membrane protein [Bacteroides faecium]|uniref:RagB/SusD family nutrient uptake outer membrane protein n=1 Tax=Bacteroides faecium TaxID=2715212 RepID=A0A6H0KHS7_9BACE|nr:RagB/SusD family nutrient uptake outer membrane protein [Bacteroides faecium]QIU92733.1 RagB/SusD family nutrient uptake outer membrane protein [Bacteroides faecium]